MSDVLDRPVTVPPDLDTVLVHSGCGDCGSDSVFCGATGTTELPGNPPVTCSACELEWELDPHCRICGEELL